MGDDIDAVLEEIIVDAYGDDEQLWAFRQFFEDEASFPFPGHVVGTAVDVVDIDYDGDERRGLVAVCRRDGKSHRVSLYDVVGRCGLPPHGGPAAAYRRWSGRGAGAEA